MEKWDKKMLNFAKKVISIQISGLKDISDSLDANFSQAVDIISFSSGRVIVCGMGKSGLIGKKIAATFASTGTPSFFMHPAEAFHGDLGMVKSEDVFLALSNSGETDEILQLLPFLQSNNNKIISLTGNENSSLALNSNVHISTHVRKEACPLQLAPTASTTATLVMGDALAMCLMEKNKFTPTNFARFHPGGSLGRKLLYKTADVMDRNVPIVDIESDFKGVVSVLASSRSGFVLSTLNESVLIITDGDLKRAMDKFGSEIFDVSIVDYASVDPLSIAHNVSVDKAYQYMDECGVNILLIKDEELNIVGYLKK
ncbi:KpsF/GutQ family sugar-phosphate isomerase [Vibrio sp. 1CM8B]|uniref:KpsF/GutQ family sugar-phosphate isomerase n=1 Tax=Vibrio sp. 1CM8B TaxID=2929167 RepID=UPI0020BE45CF|nr:KpsF/GutQ family sugar-phosphate isomerase [Vibrio sp. 1CM8B]MCK8087072.1 KpsF/GutQ family sugar-phosphate isomerase [Vibrio sp. 1CM8B]